MTNSSPDQSQQNLQALFDTIDDFLFILDYNGDILRVNPVVSASLGYSTAELHKMNVADVHPPDRREEAMAVVADILAGKTSKCLIPLMTKSGALIPVETKVTQGKWDGQDVLFGLVRDITERKQAEEALVQERNLLRTLIDNIPDGVYVKDTESRFLLNNPGSWRQLGVVSQDELDGKTDFDFLPRELAAQTFDQEQAIMQSGQPMINREFEIVGRFGHHWSLVTKVPLRDSDGDIIGLVGVSRDITERKQAEEALTEERHLLRTLIDIMPDFINIKDTESRFVVANMATAQQLGAASPDEVLGKMDFDFHLPELAAEYYAREQRIIQSGQPEINFEELFVDSATGAQRWALFSKVPLRDRHGMSTGIVNVGRDITERKQAEEALRESETLLRLLVESAEDVIVMQDPEGKYLYYNGASLYGIDSHDVIGKTPFDLHEPTFAAETTARIRQVAESGESLTFESQMDWQGKTLWFFDQSSPVKDETGQVVAVVSISRNITERKQAEESLNARTLQQAAVAELGQRALAGIDLSALMDEAVYFTAQTLDVELCKILELLPGDEEMLLRVGIGWQEGLVGQATVGAGMDSQAGYTLFSSDPVIVEDLRQETRFDGPPLLHDHGVVSGVSVIIHGRDEPFGVLGAHTTALRTFTEDDVHFLQSVANVLAEAIERKRAEKELATERTMLRTIIDNIPDSIYVKDRDSRFLLANPSTLKVEGLATEEEILGTTDIDNAPQPRVKQMLAEEQEIMRSGRGMFNQEGHYGQIWLLETKVPLRDNSGEVIGLVGVSRDITERKETKRRQFELTLREEQVKVLEKFISDASHDLRTPLTIMKTNFYLLKKLTDPEKRQYQLDVLEMQTTHLTQLLEDMIGMSQLDMGTEFEFMHLDLHELIEAALAEHEPLAEKKKQTARLIPGENIPPILADEIWLQRAITIFIFNAIQYTPDNGTITVETSRQADQVNIAVRDTGIGIGAEDLPHIFERFYRVDEARNVEKGGSGLGLSIAQKIVEIHGGSIEVESVLGEGSAFTILLLLAGGEAPAH